MKGGGGGSKVKSVTGERGWERKTERNEEKNTEYKKIPHHLGFCELLLEKILLKSNKQKKEQWMTELDLREGVFRIKA